MKAAFLTGLRQLEIREVEEPRPGPGDVLIQVKACGICGSDLRTYNHGHAHVTYPAILGHEFAGVVAGLGEGVHGLEAGNRITTNVAVPCGHCPECIAGRYNRCDSILSIGEDLAGGFAEYVLIPAQTVSRGSIAHLPAEMSFEAATLAEPLCCVLNGQELAGVGVGDTVVVIGLGTIGCLHVLAARARGAQHIIGVDRVPERLTVAQRFKANQYVNAQEKDTVAVVLEATGGRGADVTIVACGSHEAQQQAVAMAAKGGRISFFGGLPKDDPHVLLDTNRIHYREITVVGAFGATFPTLRQAVGLIASEAVPVADLISDRFPLEAISQAFARAALPESLRVIIEL